MKCSSCSKKINKTFKLCPHCGEKVEILKNKKEFIVNKKLALILGIILFLISLTFIFILNRKPNLDELKKSVVIVYVYNEYNELISTGSGVVVFENDIILTNAHVVEYNYRIEVVSEDNIKYQVEGILDYNKKKDIAILKLSSSKGLKKAELGSKVKMGSEVIAIGSPLGLKNTISTGIISANFQDEIEVYQHTAPISPGSSGGALFNSKGKLIGITYASLTEGQNLNLAIPIKHFESSYEKNKANKLIETKYYQYLNSAILKTEKGRNLLTYVLNDGFSKDYIGPDTCIPANLYGLQHCNLEFDRMKSKVKKGTFDYRTISNLRVLSDIGEMREYIKNYIGMSSGNPGYKFSFTIYEHDYESVIEWLIEPNDYSIDIYRLYDKKYVEKVKKYFDEIEKEKLNSSSEYLLETKYDNKKVITNGEYIAIYNCRNYDDCDTVKKLVEDIINQ